MKLEQSFDVKAPIDMVWAALTDVQRVAPCLPGAQITEIDEDGSYRGTFQVKLGPTTAAYRGTLRLEQRDDAAHIATMRAEGTDKRGQGGAKATLVSTLTQTGDTTTVDVISDFVITGRLARFGRGGMIQDISNRLLRDFAGCLQAQLEAEQAASAPPAVDEPEVTATAVSSRRAPALPAAAKPPNVLRLVLDALWQRLRRLFKRP